MGAQQSHRDATIGIARSAAHNPSTSTIESEAALNPSLVEKKVHRLGSGSYPDRGSVDHDSRQNALPTYLSPGRAAKRKKTKIGGTYLLQGPLGRSKPDLPTYCIGCHRGQQTPYPGRSRNPVNVYRHTHQPGVHLGKFPSHPPDPGAPAVAGGHRQSRGPPR